MKRKRIIYFVTLSTNASIVLREAIDRSKEHEVFIFFDLDGSRVLDRRYLKELEEKEATNFKVLLQTAVDQGVKLYGCQMNVMFKNGLECIDGVELAGVAAFLDLAYDADAVLSY
ncbi:DsrE/DsrF/DrsH-like family protein [Paenibacillus chondroitinus]|uniref:DsrE/DsrF/DrsH-like family protein n=1 Tax=Paenibacillus chondroitinus TaxID=59842 RepID=A0ABU6DKX5_9BACL|nr:MULTISPECIES: DsrE/DsrF/DrsH-like family protein [Paenibacillus]MCY9657151.1 DsrE/DsrF/DrsH-like family protein [Paenibacillus anseongense]MEB4798434.1 DsrE/DsrF/DrsH-like family protein [Paenibacillus chondroitinus]